MEYGHELNHTGRQLSNLVDLSSRGLIQIAAELSPTGAVREKAPKTDTPFWQDLQDRVLTQREINNAFERIHNFVGSLTSGILLCRHSLATLYSRQRTAQGEARLAHHVLSTKSAHAVAGLHNLFSPNIVPSPATLSSSLQDISYKLFEIRNEHARLGCSVCWVQQQYDTLEYADKLKFHSKVKSAAQDLHEQLHDTSVEIALVRLQALQIVKKADSARVMPPPPPWDLTYRLVSEWRERHLFD